MQVLNISHHEKITETLLKYGIKQFERIIKVEVYNKNENIKTFNSLVESAEWIFKENLTKEKNIQSIASNIRKSIISGRKAYGYIFKSEYYSKDYLKDKDISYIYKRLPSSKYSKDKYESNKIICPECNKNKINKRCNKCKACENEERKKQGYNELHNKITRKTLKELIRTTPFTTIAVQYNVTDNSIRKWCKKYDLPYKSSDIKKFSDEEWKDI